MKPNIGLSEESREAVCKILNTLLADEYVLYTKTRNYHWNVRGHQFNDLHKFFQEQYEQLAEIIDEVAERVRMLGGRSNGSLTEFIKTSRLKETPGEFPDSLTMVEKLLNDHESIIRTTREDVDACDERYDDVGTSDFLTGIMELHEKNAWMLREFLAYGDATEGARATKEKVKAAV